MDDNMKHRQKLIFFTQCILIGIAMIVVLYTYFSVSDERVHSVLWLVILSLLLILLLVCIIMQRNYSNRRFDDFMRIKEDEQQKTDQFNREIIGNVMHDLKTPLASVRGYAQGIMDGVANSPDRLNKYAFTIRAKAEDMTNLVDDLSLFSLIYQENIQYHFQKVNASAYLSKCIGDMSLDFEMKKISLIYQFLGDNQTRINIDTDKMKRVINNVVGNSVKYIHADVGMVYVHVDEDEHNLLIHISDNGEGIAQEDLVRIFERFYRTDRSRNSSTGGSGIGLSIAKKIMEDHRGEIWAESELGVGTTITFSLPKVTDKTN